MPGLRQARRARNDGTPRRLTAVAGREDDAIAAAEGLVDIAESAQSVYAFVGAVGLWHRVAQRGPRPCSRGDAPGPGDRSRQRQPLQRIPSRGPFGPREVERGDSLAALDHIAFAIRHIHDSGNTGTLRSPLTNLAIFLDRLGHYEPAATIAGFASSPLTAAAFPQLARTIAHLREALGDQTYESLARKGETMTTAAMANYAYDQIDQARTELDAVSK